MTLSHTELRRAYLSYNRRFFGGKLTLNCDVHFAPVNGCFGILDEQGDGLVLQIDPKYAITSEMWRMTLLHEMAHASSTDWKHGKRFHAEIDRLYAAGAYKGLL
jgi:hypothetical protein